MPQAAAPVAWSVGKFQSATLKTEAKAAGQQHWDRLEVFYSNPYLVLQFLLCPNRFEGSGETVFYAVQEAFNVKSLVNTLSHIYHAEMVNTWSNENFG